MNDEYGLFTGKTAELIAYYVLDEGDNANYAKDVEAVFDSVLNHFFETTDYSFCSGKSGIIWGLIFLEKRGWLDKDDLDFLEDEYEAIFKSLEHDLRHNNFDFLYGATGKLNVLLFAENNFSTQAVSLYVQKLESSLIHVEDMAFFFETFLSKEKDKVINFGFAHGLTSVLLILSRIEENKTQAKVIRAILNKMGRYFLSFKNEESLSVYPSNITSNEPDYNSAFGWCYGDLIVAVAFLNLYERTKNKVYYEESKWLTINTAEKIRKGKIKYDNHFICHGSSGVILMLFQLNKAFNIKAINETIDFLLKGQEGMQSEIDGGLITGKTGVILMQAFIKGKIGDGWLFPLTLNR